MAEIRAYVTEDGKSPYRKWFSDLNAAAAVKVTTALERMQDGNFSNAKAIGAGVSEYKINFGPGYRVYFGMDGEMVVILLCGGTKKDQSNDIQTAQNFWSDYKSRKKSEAKKERKETCH